MRKMNSKGFTLVEVLVAVAISGLVMSVVAGIFFSGTNAFKAGSQRNTDKMICDGVYNFVKQQLTYASDITILPEKATPIEGTTVLEIKDGMLFRNGENAFSKEYYGNRKISMTAVPKMLSGKRPMAVNIQISTINAEGEKVYNDGESINAINMALFKKNAVIDSAGGSVNPKICFKQREYVPPVAGDVVADLLFEQANEANELLIKMLADFDNAPWNSPEKEAAKEALEETFGITYWKNEAIRKYLIEKNDEAFDYGWPPFNQEIIDANIETIETIKKDATKDLWLASEMEVCAIFKDKAVTAIYAHDMNGGGGKWAAYGIYDTENGIWYVTLDRSMNLANKTADQVAEALEKLVEKGEWVPLNQ